jgi:glycosyltransferase involved in cell wall biosynthesis
MIVDNTYPDVRVERESNALVDHGYAVDIMCLRGEGEPARERVGHVTIYRLPVTRRRGQRVGVQLGEYATFLGWAAAMTALQHRRRPYATVQAHNVPDFLVFAAAIPKLSGAPVILDLHDLMPEFFASRFGGDMESAAVRLVRWEERLSAAFADQVITVTDLWRDRLVARGLSPGKVEVVMNLPDSRLFALRPPALRPSGQPVTIICHGSLTRRYGIDVLLRAVAIASARIPLRLILHGRGEYLPDIESLIDELGIQEKVELSTRMVPTEALPDLIAAADIGVVPYRSDIFTDGILPTKLMEYAAMGIPAIASRSKAIEAYFSADMVRLVDPGDVTSLAIALETLAADAGSRLALAAAAQRFTATHRWEDEATKYVAIVDRLRTTRRGLQATP